MEGRVKDAGRSQNGARLEVVAPELRTGAEMVCVELLLVVAELGDGVEGWSAGELVAVPRDRAGHAASFR